VVLFILPQTRSITHIRQAGNRIHHLRHGSFWFLSSSIYKWVFSVFSAAAGAENLAQSTSKPVSFWLSKIVDFDSQIDDPIRATFLTAKPGGTRVSLRSIGTFRCISGYTGDSTLLVTHCQKRRFGSYSSVHNRLNN
jgi:hypothetical protein